MFPPQSGTTLNIEALSGICGSISIACWIVVFSPQIIENFRRSSAEGLSIVFLVVWLLGDIFNIIGAVLQGVLPTMIILALYYTLADIVLILQVFYYRGFTLKDEVDTKPAAVERQPDSERQPLLAALSPGVEYRPSFSDEFRRHISNAEHLSPATPLVDATRDPPAIKNNKPTTTFQQILFNTSAILLVCASGALGWWISQSYSRHHKHHPDHDKHNEDYSGALEFDTLGQVFGYLCAVFYLGSRLPQLLLNYRRKSTEGVSLLFFLFACIGNLTYDMSIFASNPQNFCQHGPGRCLDGEAAAIYRRYISVNASWIVGSAGTLFLDMAIFVQFFLYQKDDEDEETITRQNGHVASGGAVHD